MPDRIIGKNVLVLEPNSPLLVEAEREGVKLPEYDPGSHILLDDDAKQCRIISDSELQAYYVDNNIQTYQLADHVWTHVVENDNVTLTYSSGAQTTFLLGAIDYGGGNVAQQYVKRNGVIYPVDESGHIQLDATNTPNLVYIRRWYDEEALRVDERNVEMAELVHVFADAVSNLGHAGYTESANPTEEILHMADHGEATGKSFGDAMKYDAQSGEAAPQ